MDERRATSHPRVLIIAFLLSLAVHGGLFFGLQALPDRPRVRRATHVEMQVTHPPRKPDQVVPLEPPAPRKAAPKPRARPRTRPVRSVSPPEPVAARPVPNTLPPPRAEHLPKPRLVKPIAGLTAESFVAEGLASSPVFGAGNTAMARPDTTMARPDQVQPYTRPVTMADVDTEPRLIHTPDPVDIFGADYPPEAKARGIQGITRVKLLIDEHGRVIEVKAVKGPPLLRQAAEALARAFRYEPALVGGKPVSVWWYETIPFRITD